MRSYFPLFLKALQNLGLEFSRIVLYYSFARCGVIPHGANLLSPCLSVSDEVILMTTQLLTDRKLPKTTQPSIQASAKISLLVVEDDENISTAISEYFSRAGYNVKTVEDGLMGVKAALDDPPDAVVLDLMLPKMDGLAVCRELREKANHMPILMLTAKDDVVDKVLGLEMGADDYITKPFSLRELEARIKSVLRRSRSTTECHWSKGRSTHRSRQPAH